MVRAIKSQIFVFLIEWRMPAYLASTDENNGKSNVNATQPDGHASGNDENGKGEPLLDDNAVPWFPKTLPELINHLGKTLQCGEELQADHPVSPCVVSTTLARLL